MAIPRAKMSRELRFRAGDGERRHAHRETLHDSRAGVVRFWSVQLRDPGADHQCADGGVFVVVGAAAVFVITAIQEVAVFSSAIRRGS